MEGVAFLAMLCSAGLSLRGGCVRALPRREHHFAPAPHLSRTAWLGRKRALQMGQTRLWAERGWGRGAEEL
eukprot:9032294-Alexandrium_andersonii.AAC.1